MIKRFFVDGVCYEVSFIDSVLGLVVVYDESARKMLTWKSDPGWWDDPPEFLTEDDVVDGINVMHVFCEVKQFIYSILENLQPHYLTFSANEGRKLRVYRAFAEKISKKYGYYLDVEAAHIFRMYKKLIDP